MSVRGPEVVEDNGVELAMALPTDHFDEVFVLFELHIGVIILQIALPLI
jgi:hypothetical protein